MRKTNEGKTYQYPYLLESYRDKKGTPRQRYLLNLGKLPPSLCETITTFVKGEELVSSKDVTVTESLDYAGVAALLALWRSEHLDKALGLAPEIEDRVKTMVLNRILEPCSKRAVADWVEGTALPKLLSRSPKDFEDDCLYEAMDVLIPRKAEIEDALLRERKTPLRFVLYDVTSSYFEGTQAEVGAYGHSRDKRQDREQMVLGLVTDEEGVPLEHEVYSGDTQDKETLLDRLATFKNRYGVEKIVWVGDRGFLTEANVDGILKHGADYILGFRPSEYKELFSKSEVIQLSTEDTFGILEFTEGETRYIVCHSPSRHARASKQRERKVKVITDALAQLATSVQKGRFKDPEKIKARAYRLLGRKELGHWFEFDISSDGEFRFWMKHSLAHQKVLQEGLYVLATSLKDLPKAEVDQMYRNLKWVERDFRVIKSFVEVRPVYHWKDRRIRAHVLICFLACYLLKKAELRLRKAGISDEAANVFRRLQQIEVSNIRIGKKQLTRMEQMREQDKKILRALNAEAIAKVTVL